MQHSAQVLEHFRNPRNVGRFADSERYVGTGTAGSPEAGDVLKIQVKLNAPRLDADRIAAARFRTFGCATAIAASSLLTELVDGLTIEAARSLDPGSIVTALELPADRARYATLAIAALRAALDDALC